MIYKFFSKYEEQEPISEVMTEEECFVDSKGYVPLVSQVRNLIFSGEKLESFRKGLYQFEVEDVDNLSLEQKISHSNDEFLSVGISSYLSKKNSLEVPNFASDDVLQKELVDNNEEMVSESNKISEN